jgi:hypothetical protein
MIILVEQSRSTFLDSSSILNVRNLKIGLDASAGYRPWNMSNEILILFHKLQGIPFMYVGTPRL